MKILFIKKNSIIIWEYSQLGYPKGWSNKKRIATLVEIPRFTTGVYD
jgi:hypothetical protein